MKRLTIGMIGALLASLAVAGTADATPTPNDISNISGYELYQAGATTDTTTFKAPTVSCPATGDTGIAPGTYGMVSARFGVTALLYGADVKYTCHDGTLTTQEALWVSGQETKFSHPIAPGDTITTTLTVGSTGSTVSIKDVTLPRTFTEAGTGLETYANLEYFGARAVFVPVMVDQQTVQEQLPAAQFTPISFTATTVGGKPLGNITPRTALEIAQDCLVEAQTLAISNGKNFIVTIPPVNITDFGPRVTPAGSVIEIDGVGFSTSTKVIFMGNQAAKFSLVSPTKLMATVPMASQSGPITVTNSTGALAGSTTSPCSENVTPTITKFTPTSGRTGIAVTLNGGGFNQITSVLFGVTPAVFTRSSAIAVKAVVPNGATSGPITVNTIWGTGTSTTSFTVTLSVTGFSPASGPAGTVVSINGVGFNAGSKVKFNGKAATTTHFLSSTHLTATVPAGAASGPLTVTNSTAPTGTVTAPAPFTVS
jgi:hypothetical protein